jgi:LDH2 family malate/lactate/ureidoglycolate dehydrogenase
MFDILAGVLTGSAFGTQVTHLYQNLEDKQRTGHFFVALNIDSFMPREQFFERLEQFVVMIKDSRKAQVADEILVPGEPEARRRQDALANGIPIPAGIVTQLEELAEKFGIEPI